jgi:hypothetical protein
VTKLYHGSAQLAALPVGVGDVDADALLFFKGGYLSWFSQIENFPAGGTIASVDFDGLRFKMIRNGNYAYPTVASLDLARWFTISYYRSYGSTSQYDGNKEAQVSASDVAIMAETNLGYTVGGNGVAQLHDITLQRAYSLQFGAHGYNRSGYADIGYLHARRLF